jgi:uncharacterized protein
MKCPVCQEPDLIMADRQGIEIDYCPKCRGVWLDRGELDKLIERSAAQASSGPFGSERSEERESYRYPSEYRHDHEHYHEGKRPRKRRGLLGELFDFD